MRGKKRPQRDKTLALVVAAVDGVQAASDATGIPYGTVYAWTQSEEYKELRNRKKEDADAEWWAGIQAYQRSIMEDLHGSSLRDKVGAFAIMFEKWSLLRGEPTSRSETRTWTDDLDDDEKRRLRDWIDSLDTAAPAGQEQAPADQG